MAGSLGLLGLIVGLIGVGLMIFGELKSLSASLRQLDGGTPDCRLIQLPVTLARRFGSTNPQEADGTLVDSIVSRVWGFFLVFLGFAAQAAGLVTDLMSRGR